MLHPGKLYRGSVVRLTANFSVSDVDTDPTDVLLTVMAPSGVKTSYSYGAATVSRSSAGDYYCDVTPNEAGRWFFRWTSTGSGTADASEGNFLVQFSTILDEDTTAGYAL